MMNKKDTTYENYTFWDAFREVKAGNWTEEEFHIWASTVWNDGAETERGMSEYEEYFAG